uniref:Uncharacterized protein n=1 Tax=Tanacetum cinerariifolium TaxID=118510 RepID=A0A699I0G4_TANCI|nr:hypothetical protein [Tanacetum cinerariifolium]
MVKKLERKNKLKVSGLRRLRKVRTTQRVESSVDTVIDDQEDASKQGEIIELIDEDKDVTLEEVEVDKNVKVEENADVQGRPEESHAQIYQIDLEHADKVLSMQDDESDPIELKEVVEVFTTAKLITEVVTATVATITTGTTPITAATIIAAATTPITAATITAAPSAAKKRKGVVIRDPKETATPSIIIHSEPKCKDKGKRDYDNVVLRYQALKRKPQTKAQARKNMMIYLRNIAGFKMDYFKGMSYDDIRLIFEKYFNSNVAFLEKTKEQLEEEESKALKRTMPNDDDDDVYTEATPLALKVPAADYEIYTENNKPYYKIIRADGTHQLFLSFLRNFDREDLEVLWQIVKERFESSKPKNFSDDFLLTTFTYMFEKTDVEAQMILLAEKRYPLTNFTLDQMLNNVRLEVKEESEASLELLIFVRQQQQGGFRPE